MAKSEKRQRNIIVQLRCTEAEADAFRKKAEAAGITVSELLRRSALNRRIMVRSDINMRNELKRLGGLQKHLFTQMQSEMTEELSLQFSNILVSIDRAINAMDLTPVSFDKAEV